MIRPTVAGSIATLAAACGLVLGAAGADAGPKAAIFPFELNDVSIEGELGGARQDETRRLALVTFELRTLAAGEAGYQVVDLDGISAAIKQAAPLYKCNGCEADLARRAGAEVAITGYVRKISELILKVFVNVRDAETGRLVQVHQVDIKGNTDETWLRGVRYIVVHGLAGRP